VGISDIPPIQSIAVPNFPLKPKLEPLMGLTAFPLIICKLS